MQQPNPRAVRGRPQPPPGTAHRARSGGDGLGGPVEHRLDEPAHVPRGGELAEQVAAAAVDEPFEDRDGFAKLAVLLDAVDRLLDAVDSVPLTEGDRGLLTWLGRFRPVHRGEP